MKKNYFEILFDSERNCHMSNSENDLFGESLLKMIFVENGAFITSCQAFLSDKLI